jgi:uncharacterized membrane protein (DUF106 family)
MLVTLFSGFIPALAVFFIAVVVLFIIQICYKYLVNQDKVKEIKDNVKQLNKQFKNLQKQGKTEEANKLMKEIMSQQNKMMPMTMKPMMVSMVIVIIILPGLHTIYGNINIPLDAESVIINEQEYTVAINEQAITLNNQPYEFNTRISLENRFWNINQKPADGGFLGFGAQPERVELEQIVVLLPLSLPFFGNDLGWLGWYFICSIPLMVIIKKLLGVKI